MNADTNTKLSLQIESISGHFKKLEDELHSEKSKNQKIAQEYLEIRQTLVNTTKKYQEAYKNLKSHYETLKQNYDTKKLNEESLTAQTTELKKSEVALKEELDRYKKAWAEVVAREDKIKLAFQEHEKLTYLFNDAKAALFKQRSEIEAYYKQNHELKTERQTLLARIHDFELKLNYLNKEHQEKEKICATLEINLKQEKSEHTLVKNRYLSLENDLKEAMNLLKQQAQTIAQLKSDHSKDTDSKNIILNQANEYIHTIETEKTALEQQLALLQLEIEKQKVNEQKLIQEHKKALILEKLIHEDALSAARATTHVEKTQSTENKKYKLKIEKLDSSRNTIETNETNLSSNA